MIDLIGLVCNNATLCKEAFWKKNCSLCIYYLFKGVRQCWDHVLMQVT